MRHPEILTDVAHPVEWLPKQIGCVCYAHHLELPVFFPPQITLMFVYQPHRKVCLLWVATHEAISHPPINISHTSLSGMLFSTGIRLLTSAPIPHDQSEVRFWLVLCPLQKELYWNGQLGWTPALGLYL